MTKHYKKVTVHTTTGDDVVFTGQAGNDVYAALMGRHDIVAPAAGMLAMIPFAEVAYAYIEPDPQTVDNPTDAICGSAGGECSSDVVGIGEADCMVLKS